MVLRDDRDRAALARLGLALERGGRERPDGSRLSWRVAGRDAGLGARPFFIAWDDPAMRPGLLARRTPSRCAASARSRSAAAPRSWRDWVAGDVPVQPLGDGGGLRAVVIATADGEIRLTGDS